MQRNLFKKIVLIALLLATWAMFASFRLWPVPEYFEFGGRTVEISPEQYRENLHFAIAVTGLHVLWSVFALWALFKNRRRALRWALWVGVFVGWADLIMLAMSGI